MSVDLERIEHTHNVPVEVKRKPLPSPIRALLMATGLLAVILGCVGIFLPLLPTVPFLLLAAACFARSSDRLYALLLGNPRLGPIIRGYAEGSGLPARAKGTAIATIWLTIPPSAIFMVPDYLAKALLFAVATGITIYLLMLPTKKNAAAITDSQQANQ